MKNAILILASFFISINTYSQITSCYNATPVCNDGSLIPNSVGVPSMGVAGCLFTTPNSKWLIFRIDQPGNISLIFTQGNNAPNYDGYDIDYVAWGPFNHLPDCSTELYGFPSGNNTVINNNMSSCCYSATSSENLYIANAESGKYYVILTTNYSNMSGYIKLNQSNLGTSGAGTLTCNFIVINSQPINSNYAPNGNATFNVASQNALTYQWEMSTNGTDWVALTDGGTSPQISGATSNTLNLTNIPASYSGNYFRAYLTNNTDTVYSKISQLTNTLSNSNFGDIATIFYQNNSILIQRGIDIQDLEYRIFDLNGKIINQGKINSQEYVLDLKNNSSGIYLIEFSSGNRKSVKKILLR